MENGGDEGSSRNLTQRLSNLSVNGYNNNTSDADTDGGLFQVMKAVEAAEATINQQMEENHRLRCELQKKIQEIEDYKSSAENSQPIGQWNDDGYLPPTQSPIEGGINEAVPGGNTATDNGGILTSASTSSFSPLSVRYQAEREYDPRFNVSGRGLVVVSEVQNADTTLNPSNQAITDTRDQEHEISMLRKHVADYSIKEAQIHSEKFALEKRIAYMRLAFDQQQKDLVDAESKALSYRQEIIEENIRLTYALQDAEEERSTFVSSLMPLLAEYSLQPPVVDAQSIVSNVKVLFRHLQEKLIGIEKKLKESQYQLAAWRSDSSYPQSPLHLHANQNGLELVTQQTYPDGQLQSSSDHIAARGWDVAGPDSEPLINRSQHTLGTNANVTRNSFPTSKNEEVSNKQVTFSDPVSSNDVDVDADADVGDEGNEGEPFASWNSKNSPYVEDPNLYSPNLTPVLEEPGSSFSEVHETKRFIRQEVRSFNKRSAADDDPLPTVESLQISGDAFPGRQLLASGYSLNGTTSCNFEWVRHMEDGSVNYIDGAKQPTYLVTADDVDTYLAIEVQPMDNRKRKGELVKVFANEHRKIVCDADMHEHIRRALQTGHAEHRLSLWTGYLDIWEPVTLVIKKDGINIKGSASPITDKFSPTTTIFIPCGNPVEFFIYGLESDEIRLRVDQESAAISSRDVIVLTMKYFIKRAVEKKKVKKKGIFF